MAAARRSEWIGTPAAAARLGVSTRTLYRLIDTGELVAYRFGRLIRMRVTDVDAYADRPGDNEPDGEPPS